MNTKLAIILKGHILNPFWKSRMERRRIRGEVTLQQVSKALDRYIPFIKELKQNPLYETSPSQDEHIYSIWLQGEQYAPEVVKACWRSVRANCQQDLVILDAGSLLNKIELPDYIIDKWKSGEMRHAHFADICRLALLEKYGGLWMDATDWVGAPLPDWLWEEDFFLYMSGSSQRGWYSYIQNCFIRARKGDFLVSAWLRLILEYWRTNKRPVDYFVHQLLFKKLIENNEEAAGRFAAMPKMLQDPTHEVWFAHGNDDFHPRTWDKLTGGALFQKTEYKSKMAQSPRPGSNAAHLIETF